MPNGRQHTSALKLAIFALKQQRQKYYAYSASLADYVIPPPDFAVKAKKQYDEYTEAIEYLEKLCQTDIITQERLF
jgi:hypothetical protein